MVHLFPIPQRYFNPNDKFGYMALSSIRYTYTRLVAYQISQIFTDD